MNKSNRGLIRSLTSSMISAVLFFSISVITGCDGGAASGGSSGAPSSLTYATTSAVYTANLKIADNTPKYSGMVDSWSVEPDLPDGLEIDSLTGVISGTPVTEQQAKEYKVTASNSSGETSAVVSITVNHEAPAALTYSATSAIYTIGLSIPENNPTVTGTVSIWSIIPALPDGLVMDPFTGIISGTPVKEQPAKYYTITAENSGGSTTAQISIVINSAAPSDLSYSHPAFIYNRDITIPENKPSVSGTVASWSITPDLPEGLVFDTSTGIISGIPSEIQEEKSYTVTASNSGGSTSAVIKIAVNDQAPTGLSYTTETAVYTVGEVIISNTPHVTGTVATWSVTPALPAGLTLNTTTGVISGTPAAEQTVKTYTVTASNTGGSAAIQISIKVNYSAPYNLSYTNQSAVYTKGVTITGNTPVVNGTVTSWSVTPELPQGLILNTTTGVITGMPEVLQIEKSYTIIATNSGGSTSTTISIKVNDVAPAGLYYTPSTVRLGGRGSFGIPHPTSITMTPYFSAASSDVTITSWTIDKALPSGVSFNTSNGVISGTGLATSTVTYTITASNSGGSVSTVITITGP